MKFKGCQCSKEKLSPKQFALCAAESTCRIHCQANGKSFTSSENIMISVTTVENFHTETGRI